MICIDEERNMISWIQWSEDTRGVFEKTEGESREKKVEQQQTVIRKGEEKEGK